jgi:exodeoxyribonuclease V gamma subunit
MPVTITPHQDFESLLGELCLELCLLPSGIQPHPVIIPSISFGDHLQLAIARARGLCMGIEFLTASGFLNKVMEKPAGNPWDRDRLAWRIMPHVKNYAVNLGIDADASSSRDLFAISELLADRLDQYGHFRPEMIHAWSQWASGISDEAWNSHEEWQRKLWGQLMVEDNTPHPALRLLELRQDIGALGRIASGFPKLTVLGSGSLDPLLVGILKMLSETDSLVGIHIVLPTKQFLGDIKRNHLPAVLKARRDPEADTPLNPHPLLGSMGRHAVGTFQLLGEIDENYVNWPEYSPQGESDPTAQSHLIHLQQDIRNRGMTSGIFPKNDQSIRIHSCFGPRREMETLRDELLRAFSDLKDLKPHEIHIVTPSLETYAPLVQAVLEETMPRQNLRDTQGEGYIGVRLTEMTRSSQDQATIGLLSLLEMSSEGCHQASWVMELLHLKAVQDHLGIKDDGDLEKVRSWVKLSGLTRGIDDDQKNPVVGSWAFARHRLVAGAMLGDSSEARYPGDGFVLPVMDELASGGTLLGNFTGWLSSLEETMITWQESRSPSEWSLRLKKALADLLGCEDGEDLSLVPHLRFLGELELPDEVKVDAGTILDWLDGATGEERRRTQSSGKTAFGQFKHLQILPCRVLAMVGMQDGAFPARNRTPAWDLLQAKPAPWDRNPRIMDRQLFLDALLTPKERLIITAPTRNVRSSKEEPFSSCVDELLRVLALMGADRRTVLFKQRLQPFSAEYFHADPSMAGSHSKANAAIASAISLVEADGDARHPQPFWDHNANDGLDPDKSHIEIPLKDLIGFWKDPARGFVKAQGVLLPRDEEDDTELDRPPTTLDALESWAIKDEILRELVFGDYDLGQVEEWEERLKARLSADRKLPLGELGEKVWLANLRKARPLAEAIRTQGVKKLPVSCTLQIQATTRIPELSVMVTGEVLVTDNGSHLVAFHAGKTLDKERAKPKYHIAPFISAIMALHDQDVPSTLPTLVFGEDQSSPRELRAMLPADFANALREAVTWQQITNDLVTGYLEGHLRPVCYGLETSDKIVELMKDKRDKNGNVITGFPFDEALPKAVAEKWNGEDFFKSTGEYRPREGGAPGASLAWRDLDRIPFPGTQEDWETWTNLIAKPLNAWSNT